MFPTPGPKTSITAAAALALTFFTAPAFADHVESSTTDKPGHGVRLVMPLMNPDRAVAGDSSFHERQPVSDGAGLHGVDDAGQRVAGGLVGHGTDFGIHMVGFR